jgi:hypothetical protein
MDIVVLAFCLAVLQLSLVRAHKLCVIGYDAVECFTGEFAGPANVGSSDMYIKVPACFSLSLHAGPERFALGGGRSGLYFVLSSLLFLNSVSGMMLHCLLS